MVALYDGVIRNSSRGLCRCMSRLTYVGSKRTETQLWKEHTTLFTGPSPGKIPADKCAKMAGHQACLQKVQESHPGHLQGGMGKTRA